MTNDHSLISIIIPVYNAESFLEECLRSVINQTYQNLQIIVVNDNSSDKSKDIINKYIDIDSRIEYLYVNKHNAAQTRRKGIESALGEYVCFVDADDILHEKYVELLYFAIQKTDARISTGKISIINSPADIKRVSKATEKVHIESDLLAYFGDNYHSKTNSRHIAQSINAKLFNKDLFNDIDYSVLKTSILEDNYIISQVLRNVKPQKIAILDDTIYYYRQNQNSTMGTVLSHKIRYRNKEVTYPYLFEETMEYIKNLFGKSDSVEFYINKIKAEEYYNLAQVVVDRNIQISQMRDLLKGAEAHILEEESQREALTREIKAILGSKSYKIGHALTSPLRVIKKNIPKHPL